MLYFAYGSNLLKSGMRERCPAAVAVGRAVLADHRRVFRTWADVEPAMSLHVPGGVWRITPLCLPALDDYEEVEVGLYRRLTLTVEIEGGGTVEALVYQMTVTGYAPPEPDYLATILLGCRDFGLDEVPVSAAAEQARVAHDSFDRSAVLYRAKRS